MYIVAITGAVTLIETFILQNTPLALSTVRMSLSISV
jgi:hypothetical protein